MPSQDVRTRPCARAAAPGGDAPCWAAVRAGAPCRGADARRAVRLRQGPRDVRRRAGRDVLASRRRGVLQLHGLRTRHLQDGAAAGLRRVAPGAADLDRRRGPNRKRGCARALRAVRPLAAARRARPRHSGRPHPAGDRRRSRAAPTAATTSSSVCRSPTSTSRRSGPTRCRRRWTTSCACAAEGGARPTRLGRRRSRRECRSSPPRGGTPASKRGGVAAGWKWRARSPAAPRPSPWSAKQTAASNGPAAPPCICLSASRLASLARAESGSKTPCSACCPNPARALPARRSSAPTSRSVWAIGSSAPSWLRSAFEVPILVLACRDRRSTAWSGFFEGRYRWHPRWQIAGRAERIEFGDVTGASAQPTPWDAPVTRLEGLVGFRGDARRRDSRRLAAQLARRRARPRTRQSGSPASLLVLSARDGPSPRRPRPGRL